MTKGIANEEEVGRVGKLDKRRLLGLEKRITDSRSSLMALLFPCFQLSCVCVCGEKRFFFFFLYKKISEVIKRLYPWALGLSCWSCIDSILYKVYFPYLYSFLSFIVSSANNSFVNTMVYCG